MTERGLPFDRVRIALPEGLTTLTVEEFVSMPLEERIGHMLSGRLRFFSGEIEVNRRLALGALRLRALNRD